MVGKHICSVSVLLAILVLLPSCKPKLVAVTPPSSQDFHEDNTDKTKDPEGLKLMSFNIRYQTDKDTGDQNWTKRRTAIWEMVNLRKPDIMGLQECWKSQRDDILRGCTDYGYIGVGRDDGKEGGEMVPIFYRKSEITIEQWGTFWLSETPDVPSKDWDSGCNRCATWAKILIKSSGKRIFYVNTHLDHVTARAEQMEVLERKMEEINTWNLPAFLTADFNERDDSHLFDHVQTYMYNARKTAPITDNVKTYNSWGKTGSASIIDIIFYSKDGATALKYRTVTESYKGIAFISDHYPIYAIFSI